MGDDSIDMGYLVTLVTENNHWNRDRTSVSARMTYLVTFRLIAQRAEKEEDGDCTSVECLFSMESLPCKSSCPPPAPP